jgi:tetratricopeptide (TPR) repeat protein
VQQIGEGGMGEVWLAEQREPVRRRVALKLIKAGINSREIVARFESERQALALMDHPAIAKVLDAGSTPDGTPYFVMDYVAGVPITAYCDQRRLNTRQRLELFLQVCEGVQHAHQKAIIHRDLKPSNILVTEVDGRPAPKIIDFGVAKALTQRLIPDTIFTRVGAIIGTPEYMSPEQALSSGEDIDTRSDVYSLGIVLYELLAGTPPIDLRKIALDEFIRRLREEDPQKPSTKIRTQDPATSMEVAHKRQTEPQALAKLMRGDLDSIALKALEKHRSRRYGSPSDFAADVRRHLNDEPVSAVPPSTVYRARKFAQRYQAALVTACAFVLVIIGAAAVSIRQSIRANREAAVAKAVNDFLQNDLLLQAGPRAQWARGVIVDPDLKVRTLLDRAADGIATRFGRQPEVEASIRDTIGQAYMDLGPEAKAQKQFERALDLRRRVLGVDNPNTLRTGSRLAEAILDQGRYREAQAVIDPVLKIQRRVLGPEHPETLHSMYDLAVIQRQQLKYPQAKALLNQVFQISRRVLGPEDGRTLDCLDRLVELYYREGNYLQAEDLGNRVLEIRRRVLGPEHPDTVRSLLTVGDVYGSNGRFASAEAIFSQALEIWSRVLGAEHGVTLGAANNLAEVYRDQGKYAKAEALDRRLLEVRRRTLGPDVSDTLLSMENLADDYSYQAKYQQAEALFEPTAEKERRLLGLQSWVTLATLSDMAFMYQREGKYASAEAKAAEVLAAWRRSLHSESAVTAEAAADLALAYVSQRKFNESEPLAREATEFDRKNKPDDWRRFRAESLLGATLAGMRKYVEAEPLLLEGYQGMQARKDRMAIVDQYHLDRAREWLVQLYQAWGRPEKAAEWKKK